MKLKTVLVLFLLTLAAPVLAADEWFEVQELDAGLPPPPDSLDRTTPQGALESFLRFAKAEDWRSAAQLLDLHDVPVGDQPAIGAELARNLYTVIDRKVVVDWQDLPDRPDAALEPEVQELSATGVTRRSLRLWIVDLEDRPVSIRLVRLKPEGAEPAWVFSRQTVANLPDLAALYGPSRFEQALPTALLATGLWGLRYWEMIGLPLLLILAAAAGTMLHRGLGLVARRLPRGGGGSLLDAARGPLTLAAVVLVLSSIGRNFFVFSGKIDAVLSPVIGIGFTVAAMWLIVRLADAAIDRMIRLEDFDLTSVGEGQEHLRSVATNLGAARRIGLVIVTFIGVGVVLNEASVFRVFGLSLLASAGALTLILGFAARNVLANVMSSLQIALNQSAKIGDRVLFRDRLCTVERINFTFVQLRVWTGERLVVPVVEFVAEPFENWTMQDSEMTRTIILRLAHDAGVDRLRAEYDRILDDVPDGLQEADQRGVYVTGHDVFGQEVMFLVPCTDPNTAWSIACEVREKLVDAARRIAADESVPMFPEAHAADAA